MKLKSKPVRVSEPTHQILKIDAARKGLPIQEVLENLIRLGRKFERKTSKATK